MIDQTNLSRPVLVTSRGLAVQDDSPAGWTHFGGYRAFQRVPANKETTLRVSSRISELLMSVVTTRTVNQFDWSHLSLTVGAIRRLFCHGTILSLANVCVFCQLTCY